MGKMDLILRDSHVDTGFKTYIPIHVIVPTLEYAGEVRGGNAMSVKQLEMIRVTAVKNTLDAQNRRVVQH